MPNEKNVKSKNASICNQENNVPSLLSPQELCGNLYTCYMMDVM